MERCAWRLQRRIDATTREQGYSQTLEQGYSQRQRRLGDSECSQECSKHPLGGADSERWGSDRQGGNPKPQVRDVLADA
eukprot:15483102-Alexandrium_andersonii.AAC.1